MELINFPEDYVSDQPLEEWLAQRFPDPEDKILIVYKDKESCTVPPASPMVRQNNWIRGEQRLERIVVPNPRSAHQERLSDGRFVKVDWRSPRQRTGEVGAHFVFVEEPTALMYWIRDENRDLDEKDLEILNKRAIAFMTHKKPMVGDFVDFSNGVKTRISLLHETAELQTADLDKGSFHLFEGSASFSGTLRGCIPIASLTLTEETRMGKFWFFHHGEVKAYNAVYFKSPCRVWKTALEAGKF